MKFDKLFMLINRIKDRIIKSKKLILIIVFLLLVDMILGLISRYMVGLLPEQNEAKRWSEEKRMAQVSVFFTEDQLIDDNAIKKYEYSFKDKLILEGAVGTEEGENGEPSKPIIIDTIDVSAEDTEEKKERPRFFSSCYSAQGVTTVSFDGKSAENVATIGVGGDFFQFHPLELVSGQFFDGDDLMKDSIVIDEELAWELFGSNDVAGEMVTIGNVPHYITGVVKRPDGRMRKASGLDSSIAYISYDSLCKYGTILSGRTKNVQISENNQTANIGGINCFEVVAPNPVDGLVKKLVTESVGIDERNVSVIDNTDRFSFFSLVGVLSTLVTRSMWNKAIYYPYWENTARGYEDIMALLLLIRLLCRAMAILLVVVTVINLYRNKTWTIESALNALSEKKYDLEVKIKQKRESKANKQSKN